MPTNLVPKVITPEIRDVLLLAADRLDEYAGLLSESGDTGTIQLGAEVRKIARGY